jgi:hypothetical protein
MGEKTALFLGFPGSKPVWLPGKDIMLFLRYSFFVEVP